MNGKILTSLTAIAVASMLSGAGLFAFFTDSGESTDNVFGAATVDLKLGGLDSISGTISASDMLPGVAADCVETDVAITHEGTADANDLELDIAVDVSAESGDLADYLNVTGTTYDAASVAPADADGIGGASFADWDVDNTNSKNLVVPEENGVGSKTFHIKVCLNEDAGNAQQGGSATITFRFLIRQNIDGSELAA